MRSHETLSHRVSWEFSSHKGHSWEYSISQKHMRQDWDPTLLRTFISTTSILQILVLEKIILNFLSIQPLLVYKWVAQLWFPGVDGAWEGGWGRLTLVLDGSGLDATMYPVWCWCSWQEGAYEKVQVIDLDSKAPASMAWYRPGVGRRGRLTSTKYPFFGYPPHKCLDAWVDFWVVNSVPVQQVKCDDAMGTQLHRWVSGGCWSWWVRLSVSIAWCTVEVAQANGRWTWHDQGPAMPFFPLMPSTLGIVFVGVRGMDSACCLNLI